MLQTIEGIYKDGKVELAETPQGILESRVIVTFLATHTSSTPTLMTFGIFSGVNQSTEDDFELAEFSGDGEDGLDWK